MQTFPWTFFFALLALALVALASRALRLNRKAPRPLPAEWALTARPVFTTNERRLYRLLREALPQYIILSKLPLVRFCQPVDANQVRYWYDLLGANHIAFAVCAENGRVLAAVDLDTDRSVSRRVAQIKQSVLAACRIRHLRCAAGYLPSVDELQQLVPHNGTAPRAAQPASTFARPLHTAADSLSNTVATRRAQRTALWQDSNYFQDSFFALDSRLDGISNSEFGNDQRADPAAGDIAGIVVDTPHQAAPTRH